MDTQPHTRPVISVVIPMFNEAEIVGKMHHRLAAAMATLASRGKSSTSTTAAATRRFASSRRCARPTPTSRVVNLSRNFGKEIATTAGLDHARGDAVIVIDADLQDPPEVIPILVAAWHDGYDMVYARAQPARRRHAG